MGRATSCQQRKTSVKILMNANTIISAATGSAGTQMGPSAAFATRATEHQPLATIVKISMNAWRTRTLAREENALILRDRMIVPALMDSNPTIKDVKILMNVSGLVSAVPMGSV